MNKFKEHDISGKSSKHLVETFLLKQANGGIDLQCQRGMLSLYVCVCVCVCKKSGLVGVLKGVQTLEKRVHAGSTWNKMLLADEIWKGRKKGVKGGKENVAIPSCHTSVSNVTQCGR